MRGADRFRKRVAQRAATRENDIYVSRASRFGALLSRARKVVVSPKFDELHVHGMGAAMDVAVRLVLALRDEYPNALILSPRTSSVMLVDDYEPLVEGLPPITRTRFTSKLTFTVRRRT